MQVVITSFALRRAHLQNSAIRARLAALGPELDDLAVSPVGAHKML